jgi:hypothetical protein
MRLYLSFSVFRNADESLPGWESTCDEELFRMGISTQENLLLNCLYSCIHCLLAYFYVIILNMRYIQKPLKSHFCLCFSSSFCLGHKNYNHLMLKMLKYAICFIAFDHSDWLIVIATGILYG